MSCKDRLTESWLKSQYCWLTKITKLHMRIKSRSKKAKWISRSAEQSIEIHFYRKNIRMLLLFAQNVLNFTVNRKIFSHFTNAKNAELQFARSASWNRILNFRIRLWCVKHCFHFSIRLTINKLQINRRNKR